MRFRKKVGTGNHRFKMDDGRKITVRPGEIVTCKSEKILEPFLDQYEIVDSRDTKKKKSLLEQETERQIFLLKKRSPWLTEKDRSNIIVEFNPLPQDLIGLQRALESKTDDGLEDGAMGALPEAEHKLKLLWNEWKNKCRKDPLKKLDPAKPKGKHILEIAITEAKIHILKLEIEVIKKKIEEILKSKSTNKKDELARKKYKGVYKSNANGDMIICDGRKVILDAEKKPIFEDDNSSVNEYLEECKKHKREKYSKQRRKRTRRKVAA